MTVSIERPTGTKPCKCGKKMIPAMTGLVKADHPAIFTWEWRCYACGRTEEGGAYRQPDPNRLMWEIANQ